MDNHLSFENPNFGNFFSSSLSTLLNTSSFCDVTLVCDDGQLSAHKVILAASSIFFSSVFNLNPHNHPLMYLRGVTTDTLQSLLQFIYTGVTAVHEENVSSFLAVAADLKIGGLVGYQEGFAVQENNDTANSEFLKEEETFAQTTTSDAEPTDDTLDNSDVNSKSQQLVTNNTVAPLIKAEQFADPPTVEIQKKEIPRNFPENQFKPLIRPNHNVWIRKQSKTPNLAGKTLSGQPTVQLIASNVLTAVPTRKSSKPAIFCPVCQKTDHKTNNIKVHMESKREVQCKACKLFFANCFSLSKHVKGLRCKKK